MKRFTIITMLLTLALTVCFADSLTVMDTYDLLTPDEVKDGVLFDRNSLFAYRQLDDETIMLVRYTWAAPQVTVPTTIEDLLVVWICAYAFHGHPGGRDYPPLGRRPGCGRLLLQQREDGSDLRIWRDLNGRILFSAAGLHHLPGCLDKQNPGINLSAHAEISWQELTSL